jgi:hypothetical protein
MLVNNKYDIAQTERFNPDNFPSVIDELNVLNESIHSLPAAHKADIIISYLKDHSLKTEWIGANPELTGLITSNFFRTSHIELLFASCRGNATFLTGFEEHLKKGI